MLGRAKPEAGVKRYRYSRDKLSNQGAERRYYENRDVPNM